MLKNFDEIYAAVKSAGTKKRVALAAAHDKDALVSAADARREGLADFVLIGDTGAIAQILGDMGENVSDYELVESKSDAESAAIAASMVAEGKADAPMKGILHTSVFLKAILNSQL